jgi:3-phenylpropionate/trans-cinnamate dioxygenase ferredoxin subunit
MADPDARFVVVARCEHLPDGRFAPVMLDGHGLVLARQGDDIYAFQGTCPHEQADLAQARIEDGRVICPRHLASFSLADGQVSRGWKVDCLKLYPVRVTDSEIAVDVQAVRRNPPAGARKVWDLTGR